MPSRGTDYEDLNRRLTFTGDGLGSKKVGAWTKDKLAILAYYLPAFAKLCADKVGGWYYVDGFAGNGVNHVEAFGPSKGSALIGLTTEPLCTDSILIEADADDSRILAQRQVAIRGGLSTTLTGDCNLLLPAALASKFDRRLPGFCMFDPYGLDLDWSTVLACREHRLGIYPYELLVYFPTPGANRAAAVEHVRYIDQNESRLRSVFGNDSWKAAAADIRAGRLKPGEGAAKLLEAYKARLRSIGYETVEARPITRGNAEIVYHMVFATCNEAGASIMSSAFQRAFSLQLPLQF